MALKYNRKYQQQTYHIEVKSSGPFENTQRKTKFTVRVQTSKKSGRK